MMAVAPRLPGAPGGTDREDRRSGTRARQICLRLLTLEPKTRAQLAGALRRHGIPGHAADDVLDRFTDVGLIDDAAFARAWVESRHHSRGLAGRALTAELKQRGVATTDPRGHRGLGPEAEADTARRLVAGKLAAQGACPRRRGPAAGRDAGAQGLPAGPGIPRCP